MLAVEKICVMNMENAIRGARNPMNSWAKMDSYYDEKGNFVLGENDLSLARRLAVAGSDHRKYLRQIFVSMDITAPLYWWKEFDTYKVGTVANSCSTMHKIAAKEFTLDDFSCEHLTVYSEDGEIQRDFIETLNCVIDDLNVARKLYLETKDKKWWWQMIQLLPTSYNQKRTITMNYENAVSIIHQRTNHKLDEWREFIDYLLNELPYIKEIIDYETEMQS